VQLSRLKVTAARYKDRLGAAGVHGPKVYVCASGLDFLR
jgi:hypothetical protein